MNKNKFLFKVLSLASVGMLLGSVSFAASYTDTEGHWADKAIERWTSYSIVEGYGEKVFKPDGNMTRAELAQVVNKLLVLKNKSGSKFSDVDTKAWFYDAISACNNAGIVEGVGDNLYDPNTSTKREEAMVMIGRALDIIPDEKISLEKFEDADEVSDWAKGYISAMVSKDIVKGVEEGILKPRENIKRAEVLEIINNTISTYIAEDGEYEISEEDDKIILSVAKDVKIKGSSNGNIIIAQGAEDGKVDFDGVKSNGEIIISADDVTISVKGTAEVGKINVIGSNNKIIVDKGAKTETIEVRAEGTEIKGEGNVSTVDVMEGAKNTSVETEKTKVNAAEGSEGTVADGKEVEAGHSVTTPSSSGGSTTPEEKYTVTFDGNGGNITGEAEIEVSKNGKVEMPEIPVREGYKFEGWFLDDKEYDFESEVKEDIILKAMWKFEIKDQETFEKFASGKNGEIDIVEEGIIIEDITLNSGISISRGLIIDGGNHTITISEDITSKENGEKYVICITAGESEVKVSNVIIDAASKARGVQAYMSIVEFENVTIKNSTGEGLLVNGAKVKASGLKASGNVWGSINIDNGKNVPEDTVPTITIDTDTVLEDRIKIWSELVAKDISAGEILKAEGMEVAKIDLNSVSMYVWDTKEALEEIMKEEGYCAYIMKDNVKVGYKTMQDAVSKAEEGEVIVLIDNVELTGSALEINKNITIDGGMKTISAKEKTDITIIKIVSSAKIQNVIFNLENSESRAIYVYNEDKESKLIVDLISVTIENGKVKNSGSAIATKGNIDMKLDSCIIRKNVTLADDSGLDTDAAVFFGNTTGTLTIVDTQIVENESKGSAGGVWVASTAKLVVSGTSTITGNKVTDEDGCTSCKEGADIFINANKSGIDENKGATATIEGGTIGNIHVETDGDTYAILKVKGGNIEKVHGNGNKSELVIESDSAITINEEELDAGQYKWSTESSKWEKQGA